MTMQAVIKEKIIRLPRRVKQIIVIGNDIIIIIFSFFITFFISSIDLNQLFQKEIVQYFFMSSLVLLFILKVLKLYDTITRYLALYNFLIIFKGICVFTLICIIYLTFYYNSFVTITFPIIQSFFLFSLIIFSRNLASNFLLVKNNEKKVKKRALIYGAGEAGIHLSQVLEKSNQFQIIGFLDDNVNLHNRHINNLKILNPDNFSIYQTYFGITEIILAIPSLKKSRKIEIIDLLSSHKFNVYSLPDISEYTVSKISVIDLKKVDIADITSRSIHEPIQSLLRKNINNKIVMITGGGGSIGQELAKQSLLLNAKTLLIIDMNELGLYGVNEELEKFIDEKNLLTDIIPILMSVCDQKGMEKILYNYKPDIIFHAAAYKHVPIVENNPLVGLYNNVFGTLNLVKMAHKFKIKNFLLISTDKAVRPTNIMGASKRIAELIVQAFASKTNKTTFSMVRFGNVIGSSGSAIPKFTEQIKNGGPVTITHPDITRFFMTITEAAQLVIQSSSLAKGGEIFLLDMKKPVKIVDVVSNLIKLLGFKKKDELNPNGDIEIKYVGLRPG